MKLYLISITFLFLTLDYLFAKDPIVKTKYGLVRGKIVDAKFGTTNKKVSFYEGIRYGNAKRFSKPTPVEPWDNVYDATSYKSACYQFGAFSKNSDLQNHTNNKSEDCLFLNVWVPEHYKSGAVMVWIYGGGFQVGTIFTSTYDGRHLAAGGDVIVVSINYRLGPLGFLYGENESSAPGNVGLLDQILGLQWVHDNIALFGGDTNKITIFGESAGSMSVGALIISPLAKGLFHRAIMQSGAPTESIFISKDRALLTTKSFADKIGCSSNETIKSIVDCLRTKSAQLMVNATLTEVINGINFMPIYGDELLPIQTIQAMKLGKFNRNIDLMYGICKDEGTGFIPILFPEIFSSHLTLTKDLVKKLIIKVLTAFMANNSNINEVAEYYLNKLSTNATQDEFKITLGNVIGDYTLVCPTILFGEEFVLHTNSSHHVYSYRLMQQTSTPNIIMPKWVGVPHGSDIPFIFANSNIQPNTTDEALSDVMIRAWSNFAKTGSPGSIGSVEWKQSVDKSNHQTYTRIMELQETGTKFRMVENVFKNICNGFWKNKIFV